MRVKQGWSGEVESNTWAKVTIELDEGDLGRLLREAGVNINPEQIPIITAYSLLEAEAERLVLLKLMVRHGYPHEQGSKELAGFEQAKINIFDNLRGLISV